MQNVSIVIIILSSYLCICKAFVVHGNEDQYDKDAVDEPFHLSTLQTEISYMFV